MMRIDLLTSLATAAINKEGLPEGIPAKEHIIEEQHNEGLYNGSNAPKYTLSERTINSPGGRAGTSHRSYPGGESRGH